MIDLEGVGKRYRQIEGGRLFRRRRREVWALRDVDLRVARGETIGIIGRNGSGKTTMLRLLAGVSAPSAGRLRVAGSIAPLIGVGVGFDAELTGRENVALNARILGLSAEQVKARFDDIVEFSELGDALEAPVKFYSSGMFLRLAFAVAVHVEPEIMLVDEVLAVGDLSFQLKCFERLRALQDAGTTVVVVTHNLGVLRRMCDRAVLLAGGRIVHDGVVEEVIGSYHAELARGATDDEPTISLDLVDGGGERRHHVRGGETVRAKARFAFDGASALRIVVGSGFVPTVYERTLGLPAGASTATVDLDGRLLAGTYTLTVLVLGGDGATLGSSAPLPFYVDDARRAFGVADLDLQMRVGDQHIDLQPISYAKRS